jgi:hypothetical protein
MFEAIMRIYMDVVSILTLQPREQPHDAECRRRI